VRQLGGALGTALLAVALEEHAKAVLPAQGSSAGGVLEPLAPGVRQRVAEPVAAAFGHTFVWAACMSAIAALSAFALLRAERSRSRGAVAPDRDVVGSRLAKDHP
jgi:hypothetical protein